MAISKFKFIAVDAGAAGETLVDALAGMGEKKRIIKNIYYVASGTVTGAPVALGSRIRAYKNQEQLVDFSVDSFNRGTYSGTNWVSDIFPIGVDIDLSKGDGFQVGLFRSGATPTGDLQIEYIDQE